MTKRKHTKAKPAPAAEVAPIFNLEAVSKWFPIQSDQLSPGLYVQKNDTGFEVVRIVWIDGGNGLSIKVFTPDQSEEHNPFVVCHSTYQAIQE